MLLVNKTNNGEMWGMINPLYNVQKFRLSSPHHCEGKHCYLRLSDDKTKLCLIENH